MKEVLLFMTDFYGYDSHIVREIEKCGCSVTRFLDKVQLSSIERIITKFDKKYAEKKFDKYIKDSLKKVKDKKFDEVLIIFGAVYFRKKHIRDIRSMFPDAKIVYYAWDSVENFPLIKSLYEEADISFSFDMEDAKKYKVNFLPLFYINNVDRKLVPKYDVSTVMSFFVEKFESLKRLNGILPSNIRKKLYLRIRDRLYYYKIKIFNPEIVDLFGSDFQYQSLSHQEVMDIFLNSVAVIDCPLPNQSGLTMRTFEVLALKRKLITTNSNIEKYDFYSPDNIFIVRDETCLPSDFLLTPFNEQYSLSERYSLHNFIKTLLLEEWR